MPFGSPRRGVGVLDRQQLKTYKSFSAAVDECFKRARADYSRRNRARVHTPHTFEAKVEIHIRATLHNPVDIDEYRVVITET